MRDALRALRYPAVGLVCAVVVLGCIGDAAVTVTGSIHDPSGVPLDGATATLAPAPGSGDRDPPTSQSTEASGRFHTQLIFGPTTRRRAFVLRVEKPGFKPFETTVGENTYNLDIALSPLDAPMPEGADSRD